MVWYGCKPYVLTPTRDHYCTMTISTWNAPHPTAMKTALQEADATKGDDGATPVQCDAKGREIISPEEKAKRDKKAHKMAVEERLHHGRGPVAVDQAAL